MSNIITSLKENSITFLLKYYGEHDFATHHEIKDMIENREVVMDIIKNNSVCDIITTDDYINYHALSKIIKFSEVVNYLISEDNKGYLCEIIGCAKISLEIIKTGDIIKFINANYQKLIYTELLDLVNDTHDDVDLFDVTYNYCIEYQNGISNDVMLFLINYHSYKLFDDYDKWNKKIEKDEELYNVLFSDNIIKENLDMRASIVYNVVGSLKDRNISKLASTIVHIIDLIIDYGEKIYSSLTVENVMQLQRKITEISDLLKKLKHPKANDFLNYEQKADDLLGEYLNEHGKTFGEPIDISYIRELLNSNQDDTLKLLSLTHSLKGDMSANGLLNNGPSDKKRVVDCVSTNIKTDNYFTFTHQMYIKTYLGLGSAYMNILITDEQLFAKSAQWYCLYINTIMEKCEYDSEELRNDFELLFQMLQNIFWSSDKDNQLLKSSLCYGGATFICAFSEKIMRIVYKQLKREIEYIPIEKITMGQLLSDSNDLYKEIFGEYQLKHFRYFFTTDGENKIGFNLRNNLAHWSNMKPQQLNHDLVLRLMYLLTCIINSLFYHLAIKPFQKDNE